MVEIDCIGRSSGSWQPQTVFDHQTQRLPFAPDRHDDAPCPLSPAEAAAMDLLAEFLREKRKAPDGQINVRLSDSPARQSRCRYSSELRTARMGIG